MLIDFMQKNFIVTICNPKNKEPDFWFFFGKSYFWFSRNRRLLLSAFQINMYF